MSRERTRRKPFSDSLAYTHLVSDLAKRYRAVVATLDEWLDYVTFAGIEVWTLGTPVLLALLAAGPRSEVAVAGLAAMTATPAVVATYRGGFAGVAPWPRASDLPSAPGRAAYYGLVLGGSTWVGVQAQLFSGSIWAGVFATPMVAALALAPLPIVLAGLRRLSRVGVEY